MTPPFNQQDSDEVCPLCEQRYSKKMSLTMGKSWSDSVGMPPYSLLSKYPMVHTVEQGGTTYTFFHSESDLTEKR
jgi:hypothetical protein